MGVDKEKMMRRQLRTRTVHLRFVGHRLVLTVLAVLLLGSVAFPGGTGRAVAQLSRSKADSLSTCINSCISGECLRACIAEKPTEEGDYAATAETSFIDCLVEGLGDVGTCADIFLGEEPDAEGFWVCVGGAAEKFLRCNGSASSTSSATRPVNDTDALRVILVVAEARYQASIPADAETPKGGAEVTLQQVAADTFQECATQLKSDRKTCSDTFGGDPDGEGVCNEGSKARFLGCVKTLDAPAAE